MFDMGFHLSGNRSAARRSATRTACAILFLLLLSSLECFSADVVFIRGTGDPSLEQHDLELSAQFYGLNLETVAEDGKLAERALTLVRSDETLAVAIEASVLAQVNQKELLRALYRRPGRSVPLLIVGVSPETDAAVLTKWTRGGVRGVQLLTSAGAAEYVVGNFAGVTEQLTGMTIPSPGGDNFYLSPVDSGVRTILSLPLPGSTNGQSAPVFIETEVDQQQIFVLGKKQLPLAAVVDGRRKGIEAAFGEIAAAMIFTRHCAGDRGWQAPRHYANLTIDDPWLREPYGQLSYGSLLQEMQKHNFHTTIAFIPWNYDRSQDQAVALFRQHPERFSISVHGDNHDHKEFDDLTSRPLPLQVAAIKQSLARMEQFKSLTGIPYDQVFVFPHSIGSEQILEQLKAYNFTATVNSSSIPMDRTRPASPLFALRPVTTTFGDFPSISRNSAAMTDPGRFIAINQFLDNPIFFYCHQDFFTRGIDAFDSVADKVNQLQPDTRWSGLGEIAEHLYLLKRRTGSDYDVLTFSGSVELDNTSERASLFHIRKQESNSPAIESVSVDSQQIPFQVGDGYVQLTVPVPAGESRRVVVRYKNDLNLASIPVSKSSLRVYLLRMASDFRDVTMTGNSAGRAIISSYYRYYDDGKISPALVIFFLCLVAILGAGGTCAVRLIRRKGKRRQAHAPGLPRPIAE